MSCEIHVRLTGETLNEDAVRGRPRDASAGAVVFFTGIVRDRSREGREVLFLEYEAYEAMALRQLTELAREAGERWGLRSVSVEHRLGRVSPGEASVCIAVAAPHRGEAFEACRSLLESVKETVAIWKREETDQGSRWVGADSPGGSQR